MKNLKVFAVLLVLLVPSFSAQAYWVWSPEEGKFVNPEGAKADITTEQFEYAMQLYGEKQYDEALEQFKDLLKRYPGSPHAPEAQYRMGLVYEERGDYFKAEQAYTTLITKYAQSERFEEVLERQFKIGNLFLSGRKAKLMGMEILPSLPKAIDVFESIVENAPYSQYGDESQFRLGVAYKRSGKFPQAMEAFQKVIDNYPQSALVTEARYQLAETSFSRSNVAARDERALDSAEKHVDQFLERYPDTSVTEKASKLRQKIDEKNAEKNFKIGAYYEKDGYISSAILYFKDVAKRYPSTLWGVKAAEKLKTLEAPVQYMKDEKEKIDSEIELLRAQLETKNFENADKEEAKRKLEMLEKKKKSLQEAKEESLKNRDQDIKRREKELKEKRQRLQDKKELLKTNQSEDFKRAIERWEASLQQETEQLENDKDQVGSWKESFGMSTNSGLFSMLPMIGDSENIVESVKHENAKEIYKVSQEKKNLLEEKELLYKQHYEVSTALGYKQNEKSQYIESQELLQEVSSAKQNSYDSKKESLESLEEKTKFLEKELVAKQNSYRAKFGENSLTKIASASAEMFQNLNPFKNDEDVKGLPNDKQALLEYQMHLREKIAAQRAMVDVISLAFDEEMAMQEQKDLMKELNKEPETDVRELRKKIKSTEKEIRIAYNEISDRHEKVKHMTKELDAVLEQRNASMGVLDKTGSVVTAPARVVMKASKEFLFGRKPDEAILSKKAGAIPADGALASKAKELKKAIEDESIMIEARNREIYQLQKQLDLMKTKASLAGGYKFRSTIVDVPYAFMEEAVDSARSILPAKDRKETIIEKLEVESRALELNKERLKQVDQKVAALSSEQNSEQKVVEKVLNEDSAVDEIEADLAKKEIESLVEQLAKAKEEYSYQKRYQMLEMKSIDDEKKGIEKTVEVTAQKSDLTAKEERKLGKELEDLEKELSDLITKENELEGREFELLESKINKIDQAMQNIHSKAIAQDLLIERDRIEKRLDEINLRRNFLTRELERFELNNMKAA